MEVSFASFNVGFDSGFSSVGGFRGRTLERIGAFGLASKHVVVGSRAFSHDDASSVVFHGLARRRLFNLVDFVNELWRRSARKEELRPRRRNSISISVSAALTPVSISLIDENVRLDTRL